MLLRDLECELLCLETLGQVLELLLWMVGVEDLLDHTHQSIEFQLSR